jgi:hypothetical protein
MAGIGLLDRVHRQGADGVNRDLIDVAFRAGNLSAISSLRDWNFHFVPCSLLAMAQRVPANKPNLKRASV